MKDFRDILVRGKQKTTDYWDCNEEIEIGNFTLSIQCNKEHYCEPRQDGLPTNQYEEMEVATFYDDNWCIVKGFEDFYEMYNYRKDNQTPKEMGNDVIGYMPIKDINRLYNHLLTGKVEIILLGKR